MADCFAIFAGGGAKGFAHVGALKSAEDRNLKFVGVAGASAGSIIATLIAAGFRADDLYRIDPSGTAPLLSTIDWIELLGNASWQKFTQIRRSFDKISSTQEKLGKRWAWRLWRFYRTWSETLKVAIKDKGLFTTEGFEIWLDEVLRERLGKAKGGVTFADLEADLTFPL